MVATQTSLFPFTEFETVVPETDVGSLNLNWRERDLPQGARTKHVHALHPYLGKFIPQLVEIFLRKYKPSSVIDPFCGSGTTLVEAASLGIDSFGTDISEFNCLLSRVKTAEYDLATAETEVREILSLTLEGAQEDLSDRHKLRATEYLQTWYSPRVLERLLMYSELSSNYQHSELQQIILSRSARSARMTAHYDLDFPKQPKTEPYYCYKHKRTCQPTSAVDIFLKRYSSDSISRIRQFASIRRPAKIQIRQADSTTADFPDADLVITSPPYVGLIDYHEQHRYAYELLGLPWRAEKEIGPASKGSSNRAKQRYIELMVQALGNVANSVKSGTPFVIIVHDRSNLYPEIAQRLGARQDLRVDREVNRRTGMRTGNFTESIFVWQL